MAEDKSEDNGNVTSDMLNGNDSAPQMGFLTQYIKDLSVENPNAPACYQWQGQPQIDVQFNIGANSINEETHEVELKITVTAKAEQGTAFIVELVYATLLATRNVPAEQLQPILYAEAPRIIFPFARRILSDAVRDAGFPPLMLEPIDFNSLYLQQRAQADAQPQGNA